MVFNCPHCGAQLDAPADRAGRAATCPKCQGQFVVPGSPPPVPSDFIDPIGSTKSRGPAEPPNSSEPRTTNSPKISSEPRGGSDPSGSRDLRGGKMADVIANRFRPARSILDLFDFRFQFYVTPIIICVTWIVSLVIGALWMCVMLYLLISSWLPSSNSSHAPDPNEVIDMIVGKTKSAETIIEITQIVLLPVALMWVRVMLEQLVVLFEIMASFASRESKPKE
jgi:hypothetical protein